MNKKHSSLPDWLPGAIVGAAVVILAIVFLAWSAVREAKVQLPVQTFAIMGQDHVEDGTVVEPAKYNSNPPTSGPHWKNPKKSGVYKEELPDAQLVHNLEHGHVWISYKNPADTQTVEKIEALARTYGEKIVVTPRPKNDAPISVAAWGVLMNLETFDEQLIRSFIREYLNNGPEKVPDMGIEGVGSRE